MAPSTLKQETPDSSGKRTAHPKRDQGHGVSSASKRNGSFKTPDAQHRTGGSKNSNGTYSQGNSSSAVNSKAMESPGIRMSPALEETIEACYRGQADSVSADDLDMQPTAKQLNFDTATCDVKRLPLTSFAFITQ
jgi:hypothetical protein